MMSWSKVPLDEPLACASILLASDSEALGNSMHRMLQGEGFQVQYAGHYSELDSHPDSGAFDMVLLEVTGEHAVEAAVEAALRIKRARAGQLVGYVADATLTASGLAGDAIFPRNSPDLPGSLRTFLSEESESTDR